MSKKPIQTSAVIRLQLGPHFGGHQRRQPYRPTATAFSPKQSPILFCERLGALRQLPSAYVDAQLERAEISAAFAGFFEKCDLLLTPTVPLPAFDAGYPVPPSGSWVRSGPIGPLSPIPSISPNSPPRPFPAG